MWIESHQSLRNHPKFKLLYRTLKQKPATMAGYLHFLWWWCLDYAIDGDLTKYNAIQIAEASEWEGDAHVFYKVMVECGFIDAKDSEKHIHDWLDFCGSLVEKRLERREVAIFAGKRRQEIARKHRDKSAMFPARSPSGVRTGAEREPTVPRRTVPNQPNQTLARAHAPANDTPTGGLNRIKTPFRHKGVVGQQLKKLDGGNGMPKLPDNPVRKFLLVLKQLQGYDVKDAQWDETYLDQYNDDAVKFLKFFGMDWREAGNCAVDLVKEFKEKELSWSLRTIINRAPFWRQTHAQKETAKV